MVYMTLWEKSRYSLRWLPSYGWQRLIRRLPRMYPIHVMIAVADHFEPAIVPDGSRPYADRAEQERRLEHWCRKYPKVVEAWRDADGQAFRHTYFYPAEQYDKGLID